MFQGLSTALTALYANRQALETTGNNIANANTEGYTRQRVEMEPIDSNRYAAFHSRGSAVGTGVNVTDIARLRDQFLELRGLQEHANQASLTRASSTMEAIERSFGEPGENGLQAQLSDFWANWDDVANRPDDDAARSQVIEQAHTLVSVFGQASGDLDKLASSSQAQVKNNVTSLNAMAQNIADLNSAIRSATNSGQSPNALLDRRDLLVSKMSDLAGVTVKPTDGGSVEVRIGGVAIVRDDRVTALQVDDTTSPMALRWDADGDATTVTDGFVASVSGGDIGGLTEAIFTTIPKYQQRLDEVAANLIDTVNTQHGLGLDQNGDPGGDVFTGTSARDIAVDATFASNTRLVAAAAAGGGELDGENARAMANITTAQSGPDAEYRQLINILGVEAQRSYRQVEIQTNITNSVDASRQSAAGVNMDEELTNLIRFQKSYDAAAKYLSVMDRVLESLLGIVR